MKLFFAVILIFFNYSFADEGGNSFWFCGQFASLLAVPKTVGWNIDSKLYYFNQKDNDLNQIVNNEPAKENITSKTTYLFLEPTYTPNALWFGGQPSFTIAEAVAYDFSKTSITFNNTAPRKT